MQQLSSHGKRTLDELRARYGFGEAAAETLLRSLNAGGGMQAQFSHPELGGMGQWSAGGMIMIGDMFNNELKSRVDGFLSALVAASRDEPMFEAPAAAGRRDGQEGAGLFAPGSGWTSSEWPSDLGRPSSSGAQNDLHYAYFPDSRRLAIRKGGHIELYDTADHAIGGVSQQQSGDQSLTFTSQYGTVRLADLKRVGSESPATAETATKPPQQQQQPQYEDRFRPPLEEQGQPPAASSAPHAGAPPAGAESDVLAAIERLAGLRDRGIVTEAEFAAKKAELLSRL